MKKTLTEILADHTITNQFDFVGICPDADGNDETFTIFSTEFFLNEIEHNFFSRVAFVDDENSFTDLITMFEHWAASRGLMYARLAYAYSLGYNPIENYSSVETHSGHDDYENHKKVTRDFDAYKVERTYNQDKVERTYNQDKVERTYNQDKVERTYNQDKVERTYNQDAVETTHTNDKVTTTYTNLTDAVNKYGVNSSNAVPVSNNVRSGSQDDEHTGSQKDTHTGGYDDEHTGGYDDEHTGGYDDEHTGGYDDEHTGGYDDESSGGWSDENTGTDKQIYNSTITKSGNIGVMTASQMIQSEYDGLRQDLALRAVFDFLDRYTFYSEGVDVVW